MTENELQHHGILGQKWGVRRYQNEDGTLTSAGKSRYNTAKENLKSANKAYNKSFNDAYKYSRNHPIKGNFTKEVQAISEEKWGKAYDDMDKRESAIKEYKEAKKEYHSSDEYKADVKNKATNAIKKVAKGTSYVTEKYNNMMIYQLYPLLGTRTNYSKEISNLINQEYNNKHKGTT